MKSLNIVVLTYFTNVKSESVLEASELGVGIVEFTWLLFKDFLRHIRGPSVTVKVGVGL